MRAWGQATLRALLPACAPAFVDGTDGFLTPRAHFRLLAIAANSADEATEDDDGNLNHAELGVPVLDEAGFTLLLTEGPDAVAPTDAEPESSD